MVAFLHQDFRKAVVSVPEGIRSCGDSRYFGSVFVTRRYPPLAVIAVPSKATVKTVLYGFPAEVIAQTIADVYRKR